MSWGSTLVKAGLAGLLTVMPVRAQEPDSTAVADTIPVVVPDTLATDTIAAEGCGCPPPTLPDPSKPSRGFEVFRVSPGSKVKVGDLKIPSNGAWSYRHEFTDTAGNTVYANTVPAGIVRTATIDGKLQEVLGDFNVDGAVMHIERDFAEGHTYQAILPSSIRSFLTERISEWQMNPDTMGTPGQQDFSWSVDAQGIYDALGDISAYQEFSGIGGLVRMLPVAFTRSEDGKPVSGFYSHIPLVSTRGAQLLSTMEPAQINLVFNNARNISMLALGDLNPEEEQELRDKIAELELKIKELESQERNTLPSQWHVQGTAGYFFGDGAVENSLGNSAEIDTDEKAPYIGGSVFVQRPHMVVDVDAKFESGSGEWFLPSGINLAFNYSRLTVNAALEGYFSNLGSGQIGMFGNYTGQDVKTTDIVQTGTQGTHNFDHDGQTVVNSIGAGAAYALENGLRFRLGGTIRDGEVRFGEAEDFMGALVGASYAGSGPLRFDADLGILEGRKFDLEIDGEVKTTLFGWVPLSLNGGVGAAYGPNVSGARSEGHYLGAHLGGRIGVGNDQ